jgi:hypothetical protein
MSFHGKSGHTENTMKKPLVLLLRIFFMCSIFFSFDASVAFPYSVTLSWDAPTKNANGTPLTDLAGYNVYYGKQYRNYESKIRVGNVKEYTITNLAGDVTYYCAVTAYDSSGNESSYSDEVSTTGYSLIVNKSGTGSGTVISSPTGITCGTACTKGYDAGSIVTLTATPDGNSIFTGWSGGGCSGKGQCVLVMSATVTVTANFSATTSSSQIIIDNRDAEISRTGTWSVSSGSRPYGVDSVVSANGSTFTWHFTAPQSGNYEVSMWWTYRDSRSTNVPVDIQYSGGKTRFYINQKENGGQWNNLGRFYFKKDISYAISITAQASPTSTCADAVKFNLVQ